MNMKVNEFKWGSEEAQNDMKSIWRQAKSSILKLVVDKIKSENEKKAIPLIEEGLSFEPDWLFPEDWKVATQAKRIYNSHDNLIESEKIQFLSGRLLILRANSVPLEPSFKFILDKSKNTLFIDIRLIRKIMEERKMLEDDSAYVNIGEDFLNKNLLQEGNSGLKPNEERDIREAFKFLGHDKDEINLMVYNMVRADGFREGMALEELYALGMRVIKGEGVEEQ